MVVILFTCIVLASHFGEGEGFLEKRLIMSSAFELVAVFCRMKRRGVSSPWLVHIRVTHQRLIKGEGAEVFPEFFAKLCEDKVLNYRNYLSILFSLV